MLTSASKSSTDEDAPLISTCEVSGRDLPPVILYRIVAELKQRRMPDAQIGNLLEGLRPLRMPMTDWQSLYLRCKTRFGTRDHDDYTDVQELLGLPRYTWLRNISRPWVRNQRWHQASVSPSPAPTLPAISNPFQVWLRSQEWLREQLAWNELDASVEDSDRALQQLYELEHDLGFQTSRDLHVRWLCLLTENLCFPWHDVGKCLQKKVVITQQVTIGQMQEWCRARPLGRAPYHINDDEFFSLQAALRTTGWKELATAKEVPLSRLQYGYRLKKKGHGDARTHPGR